MKETSEASNWNYLISLFSVSVPGKSLKTLEFGDF